MSKRDDAPALTAPMPSNARPGCAESRVISKATTSTLTDKQADYWEFLKGRDDKFTWRNRIPGAIGEIFERHGFIWGGKWYHYDSFHFEYRPEIIALARRGWPSR